MTLLKDMAIVALGGGVGSALRYLVGRLFSGDIPGVGRIFGGRGSACRALNGGEASEVNLLVIKMFGSGFPWGTLAVNVVGALLIGVLYGLAERGNISSSEVRLLLMAGFCGGFTTFSALMGENLTMLRAGEFLPFALYTAASLLVGLAAVWLGWWMVQR
ncbi:MAG: CrcB family protein [Alistipes sp.]|jgi:CrcB protein|nr:CrcB family protein [Alistipes sp.]